MADLEQLISDLQSDDMEIACAAAEALEASAAPAWLPRLYEVSLDDENCWVREMAGFAIARVDGLRALPHLLRVQMLGEDDGYDNDSLVALLGDMVMADPGAAAAILLPMLHDPFERRREKAAWLLGYAAEAITAEPLLEAIRDPDPGVRGAAAGSLEQFPGRDDVFDALARALRDEDGQVRRSAAGALGCLGDRRAEPLLREMVNDPSEWTRTVVEGALRQLRDGRRHKT